MSIFRPNLRWLRFSLRTFLIVVTLICIWSAWYVNRARRQKESAEAVRTYGGWVYYDYQFDDDPQRPKKVTDESPWPPWLIDVFGVDMFHNVVEVNLVYGDYGGKREETRNTCGEIMPALEGFPELRRLYLQATQATDETMPYIGRLQKLEEFFAWHPQTLSDKGIVHLAKLNRLSSIHISSSLIGDESLRVFAKLPRVERLSLQGNHFTNQGLRYLRDMKQLKSLWIGCGDGAISDAGAKELLNLSGLEELDLQHYSISSEMRERLKKLPNIKSLHFDGGGNYVWFPTSWIPSLPTLRGFPLPVQREQKKIRRLPPLPFPDYELKLNRKNGHRADVP